MGKEAKCPTPLEGITCPLVGWKIERQPPWTAFWAFFRYANASKLSAS